MVNTNELFSQAVKLEESDPKKALQLYERIIDEEEHASSYINAGTICYNQGRFDKAEVYYRAAIKLDPTYALAYFDLGNVLDETGRLLDAIKIYRKALKIDPYYADVHYNIAIAYEHNREPRKALKHWHIYSNIDPKSAWGKHAAIREAAIKEASGLFLIRENPSPRRTKRRAKLFLVHANQ
jgi:tetratricopeptide (TPR) repeat protein